MEKLLSKHNDAANNQEANENGHQMPSLDQFMELVKNENAALAATPSGYNVYNKYSKAS